MGTLLRSLLATALALAAFAVGGASASAFSLSLEPAGAITAPSLGKITFGSGPEIDCNITLRGTLGSTATLVANAHLGHVTEVVIRNCSGGTVERVLGLPWRFTVNSILGTLPHAATGVLINIINTAFNLSTFFEIVNCLYQGNAGALLTLTGTNPYTSGLLRALSEIQLPFVRGSGLCPEEGGFAGSLGLTRQTLRVPPTEFTIGPDGPAEGTMTLTTEEGSTECELTMYHDWATGPIPLRNGELMGEVTEAEGACGLLAGVPVAGPTVLLRWRLWFNRKLPEGHLLYDYFVALLYKIGALECLYIGIFGAKILNAGAIVFLENVHVFFTELGTSGRCPRTIGTRLSLTPRSSLTIREI